MLQQRLLSMAHTELLGLREGLDRSGEDSVLCLIRDPSEPAPGPGPGELSAILVQQEIGAFLARIISDAVLKHLQTDLTPGPASVILRCAGDPAALLHRLEREFAARVESWTGALQTGTQGDTILGLTTRPVSAALHEADLAGPCLLIPMPGHTLQQRLRSEAILYITENLEDHSWRELRISIFDSTGNHLLNYERLLCAIRDLETGMILAEQWTHDNAFTLMAVPTFEIRFFTFEPIRDIKRVLMGLEYDDDGTRLVDLDLFAQNRKIPWVQAARGRDDATDQDTRNWLVRCFSPASRHCTGRKELAAQCRNELLARLSANAARELRSLDRRLRERHNDAP